MSWYGSETLQGQDQWPSTGICPYQNHDERDAHVPVQHALKEMTLCPSQLGHSAAEISTRKEFGDAVSEVGRRPGSLGKACGFDD
jgi:hypothetical protein